uniref:Platelet-derived growth factor (PDGF) family profile domain-containing protein n=1 Tax=Setaria digitata TaxID=48799 RepID=A0A915Q0C4_9BILA
MIILIIRISLLLLLNEYSLAQKGIPDDIRKRVREAETFNDLLSIMQFTYATHLLGNENGNENENEPSFDDQKELRLAEIRSRKKDIQNMKLYGASVVQPPSIAEKSALRQNIDVNVKKNLDIISKIRQGSDICELRKACIPILPENPDPGLIIFPRCYEATQCIGSCCEFSETCHPINVEYIEQPIIEMLYAGNNLFVINQTRNITIEQHTACSCRACTPSDEAIHCPRKKILGSNCQCECRNKQEKSNCQGPNKKWNDETCTCTCTTRNCYGRSILDNDTCLCYHRGNKQRYGDPDVSGNFRSDTSRLQTIRLARMRMSSETTL